MTRGFEEEEPPISDGVRCFLLNIHGFPRMADDRSRGMDGGKTERNKTGNCVLLFTTMEERCASARRSSKPFQCSDIPLRKAMLAPTPSRQKSQLRTIERFFAQGPNRILASICTGLKRGPSRLRHGDPQMGQECVAASAGRAQRRRPGRQRSQTCILSAHGFVPGSDPGPAQPGIARQIHGPQMQFPGPPRCCRPQITSSGEGSRRATPLRQSRRNSGR